MHRPTEQIHGPDLDALQRHFYSGDLAAAVDGGQAMLAVLAAAPPDRQAHCRRARVLLWLVRCARRADEHDVALVRIFAGIEAAREGHEDRLECQLWAQYVHVLASLGQNVAALDEGYKLLRRAVASGDTPSQAACWLALGHVNWAMQQWSDGEHAYTQALTLARQCGDKELCGLASNGIAAMADQHATEARAAGHAGDADAHTRRSLALLDEFTRNCREIGDGYNAWIGTHNRAYFLFGMGQHAAARELLDSQLALLGGERRSRRHLIMQLLGDIHLAEGRTREAIACQTEALEIADLLQQPALAIEACSALATALERSGNFEAALLQYRRYHALYVQLASNKAQSHARAMAVVYDTDKARALAEKQRQRADQLACHNNSLEEEKAALQRSSLEDALTGLANRRCFDQALVKAVGAAGAAPASALAMIDVDHFKRVNDRFSHLVGDEVLRRLGALLQRHCRKQDLPARFGGEEFAVILTDIDRSTARATCERLRAAVEAEPWAVVHAELQVTVSIGVVHIDEAAAGAAPTCLLAAADARLYSAKRGGRNQVVDSSA